MKKFITLILILLILTITAGAVYTPDVTTYDPDVDYMELMTDAAIDGSKYALAMGSVYEQQRNNKIADMSLDYEITNFFDGRTGAEILRDLTDYNVSAPQRTYLGRYYITGYDTCIQCCGKSDGITASGTYATVGRTIATGNEFAYGTTLYIEGIGERIVEDRGVGNGKIDVLCNNHAECYAITGWYDVYKVEG